ncbi:MAG: hypothetical protein EDS66_04520 [Planctomycetota bacterium]|nr:MAG: hypothetical protein EDS66_04520 [Planctomycetota bacterium]MCQ3920389.1 hypothetical protein [Planctomycetota bacterium]
MFAVMLAIPSRPGRPIALARLVELAETDAAAFVPAILTLLFGFCFFMLLPAGVCWLHRRELRWTWRNRTARRWTADAERLNVHHADGRVTSYPWGELEAASPQRLIFRTGADETEHISLTCGCSAKKFADVLSLQDVARNVILRRRGIREPCVRTILKRTYLSINVILGIFFAVLIAALSRHAGLDEELDRQQRLAPRVMLLMLGGWNLFYWLGRWFQTASPKTRRRLKRILF